jgi:hypothetical protein
MGFSRRKALKSMTGGGLFYKLKISLRPQKPFARILPLAYQAENRPL